MSEESIQLVENAMADSNKFRTDLEEKIALMWRAIEDLKLKVTEEKELLRKERSENERMIKEQVFLRRQLSLFHLPHCPVLAHPGCPVHSNASGKALGSGLLNGTNSSVHGDQFMNPYNYNKPNIDESSCQIKEKTEFKTRNYADLFGGPLSRFRIYDDIFMDKPRPCTAPINQVRSYITPTKEVPSARFDNMSSNTWFPSGWTNNENQPSNQSLSDIDGNQECYGSHLGENLPRDSSKEISKPK